MKYILSALLVAAATLFGFSGEAQAQSGCKYIVYGAVLTAGQWNECFGGKQDYLGFTPIGLASIVGSPPVVVTSSASLATVSCPTCATGPSSAVLNDLAAFGSTTGKPLIDSGIKVLAGGGLSVAGGVSIGSYAAPSNGLIVSGQLAVGTATPVSTVPFTVNANTSGNPVSLASYGVVTAQFIGVDATQSWVVSQAYGATPRFVMARADGTAASPTGLASGDVLGTITALGYNGSSWNGGITLFRAITTEAWSSTSTFGYDVDFLVNAAGASGNHAVYIMRLAATGVGIGTSTSAPVTPLSTLDVNGGVAIGSYAGVNVAPSNGLIVSGATYIGTTSALTSGDELSVSGQATFAGGLQVSGHVFMTGLTAGSGSSALCLNTTGSQVESDTSATICGISALRYKNLTEEITPEQGLAGILGLHGWSYRYKPGYADGGKAEHISLIADDMAAMNPDCAVYENGKVENYADRCFEAYTVGAIKALKADNDNLRAEVNRLRAHAR